MEITWNTVVDQFFLVLLAKRLLAQPSPCLLRCKDDHFNQIRLILGDDSDWSTDMVTPFQSVLQTKTRADNYRSSDFILKKLSSFCRAHRQFQNCLYDCEPSDARRFLLIGQKSWAEICGAFRGDRDFLRFVVPCWAQHGDDLGRRCQPLAQAVQRAVLDLVERRDDTVAQRMSHLCSSITEYDQCYIWTSDRLCGEKSWQFLLELNEKTSYALLELLQESRLVARIPSECQQWSAPDQYSAWHAERVAAGRRALNRGNRNAFAMFFLMTIIFFRI